MILFYAMAKAHKPLFNVRMWLLTVVWDLSFSYNVQIGSGTDWVSYSLCCGVHLPLSYSSRGVS